MNYFRLIEIKETQQINVVHEAGYGLGQDKQGHIGNYWMPVGQGGP